MVLQLDYVTMMKYIPNSSLEIYCKGKETGIPRNCFQLKQTTEKSYI